jgi:predicted small metal-binding protein
MADSESAKQWQVTCVCGWRTLGTREDVVAAVIDHGRDTHSQDVTEEEAASQLVPTA